MGEMVGPRWQGCEPEIDKIARLPELFRNRMPLPRWNPTRVAEVAVGVRVKA